MSHRPPPSKVTIEDLLKLKRAERPDAAFWAGFERELRQKQLSALLQKRPWWQQLPQFLARRAYIPVGATAVVAFTLIAVKFNAPASVAADPVAPAAGSGVAHSGRAVSAPVGEVGMPVSSPLVNRSEPAVPQPDQRMVAMTAANAELETAELMPTMLPPREVESPSARSIAANLARLEQAEPDLLNAVLGGRLSGPARVQTASASMSDLASLPTASSRRNRLLVHYSDRQVGPEPAAPDIVRERLARRLGDTDLNDRLTRLGVQGDRVSLKF
ncbi:MAG: hypothetical protein JNG83_00400 [Opitutaceae bacterium]|nr:hypothetical protein [Opitutaceae bacterium]